MAPSILVFIVLIGLGEFYVFAAVFGYFMLAAGGGLVLAYYRNNFKMIGAFRVVLVVLTIAAFFNLFIDSMIFDANYDAAIL